MERFRYSAIVFLVVLALAGSNDLAAQNAAANRSDQEKACQALVDTRNLTITSARLKEAAGSTPAFPALGRIVGDGAALDDREYQAAGRRVGLVELDPDPLADRIGDAGFVADQAMAPGRG